MAKAPRIRLFKSERYTERVFGPYTKAIGEVALSWNGLHESLGQLFWGVMGGGWMDQPLGVWNAATFDRPKRQMLRAATDGVTQDIKEKRPRLVDDIVWIIVCADKLEEKRNNAVHSPLLLIRTSSALTGGIVGYGPDYVMPDLLLKNSRALKLASRNLLDEFRHCRDTALALRDFAREINHAMAFDKAPWPRRPSLPSRKQKKASKSASGA